MYTHEDLINKIAVRCNNEEELSSFVNYAQEQGHMKMFDVPMSLHVDISLYRNPGKRVLSATPEWYKYNNFKIINFDELDMCKLIVNIEDFESILMD